MAVKAQYALGKSVKKMTPVVDKLLRMATAAGDGKLKETEKFSQLLAFPAE